LAAANADPLDFEANPQNYDIPDSVVGFMAGELGDIPGGWPEPFRSKVLAGRSRRVEIAKLEKDDAALLDSPGEKRRSTLNRLLFEAPTAHFEATREMYGDLSVLDTVDYLYGLEPGVEHVIEISPGVRLFVGLEAIGAPDDKGMRTVMATLNGQLRPVFVRDRSVSVETQFAEKADPHNAGHIPAPFSGAVTTKVTEGM
jgi:pyruvate carboxylase